MSDLFGVAIFDSDVFNSQAVSLIVNNTCTIGEDLSAFSHQGSMTY